MLTPISTRPFVQSKPAVSQRFAGQNPELDRFLKKAETALNEAGITFSIGPDDANNGPNTHIVRVNHPSSGAELAKVYVRPDEDRELKETGILHGIKALGALLSTKK